MTAPRRELVMWVIYDHPRDAPAHFVARRWRCTAGHAIAEAVAYHAPTLEAARAHVPPGLVCLPRSPADDPVIVETWV